MYRKYKEVKSVQDLSYIKDSLPHNLYRAVAEVTEIYDATYTSLGRDGGSAVLISTLYGFNAFFKEHPQLDLQEMMEYLDIIQAQKPDEQDYVNILLLAGTEYQYNLFLPKGILSLDEKGAELLHG